MKSALMAIAATAAAFLLPAAAQAAEGFATANVNMRSGPSTRYPAVTVIPVGTPVEIHGCLADTPWCDVSFYNGRGWVAGRYVQAQYQQRRVYVEPDYYGTLGIPLVTFEIGNYWDRYYRNRDFYRERDYYRRDRDRDRYNPDRRPRRDYNTYERPRYNNTDGIVIERPTRDRDRERIERRREDNARQFENEQNNRRERDRERIERRNYNSQQQFERNNNNQQRIERRNNSQQQIERGNDRPRYRGDGGGGCRPRDVNCN
ncbi:hypothetical protein ASE23_01360 [Rhizobium sp. Root73]|uniref:SH3 domain-containing protein n=1 Tax=unclassified Rhizobium TaxID=2613769 RepID=UPI0007137A96|nr:hypothetical protein ASC96_04460 [Rhizobium sp. Root1204]KQY17337.1 hypothetical protein ASD36_01360 [Rhizobium sp. Root1334]KRC13222.1 hypothetical protein ASE23_01360 [Rhizobium sp. Root73]